MSKKLRLTKTKVERRKRIVTYVTVEREVVSAGPAYVAFGAVVRELRQKLKMTQEDLASKVDLKRTSIVNIECSRQRVLFDDILRFADALHVKPEKLVAMTVAAMDSQ